MYNLTGLIQYICTYSTYVNIYTFIFSLAILNVVRPHQLLWQSLVPCSSQQEVYPPGTVYHTMTGISPSAQGHNKTKTSLEESSTHNK